jgi:uncharacterized membrane protein YeaQ/YmgE (transglycosylase-associated protein family)
MVFLNIAVALVAGGIIGWMASLVMNRDASMGVVANVLVGCAGSVVGRLLLGGLLGAGVLTSDPFDWRTLLAAFAGAVLLLAAINLVRRGRLR